MDLPDLPEPPSEEAAPSTSSGTSPQKPDSFYKQLQVVTTIVTLVVAVTAIGLSVWEGYETRRYNRLTVQPYVKSNSVLTYTRTPDGLTGDVTYQLESNGLGPAVYTKILTYAQSDNSWRLLNETQQDGESVVPNMDGTFLGRVLNGPTQSTTYTSAPLFQGFFHPEGQSVPFFALSLKAGETLAGLSLQQISDSLRRSSVVICYCSVYGEDCGRVSVFGAGPETVPCEK